MAARAMWKGSIAFGLVNIPVELHTAVRDKRTHFRQLHSKDESPIRYERVCVEEEKPVEWGEIVKGYEYEKGRFVIITKEDLESAALEKSKTVDILDFVEAGEIDDRYFETPYYLTPGKGGERGYALLREALRDSGKIGIAKIILREAQHLAAVEALGDALVLTFMRYADEVVDASELELPKADNVRPAELEMAKTLVSSLGDSWDPTKYRDEYRENLERVIAAKVKGVAPDVSYEERPQEAEVVDLMARLRASLEGGRRGPHAKKSTNERVAARRTSAPKKTGSSKKRTAAKRKRAA